MTTAEAMPASCDSDTCRACTPRSSARAWTLPMTCRCGRPSSPLWTVTSLQCRPAGAPSALASASFAANRAASELSPSPRSTSVKSRSLSPGVRSRVCPNRSTSTTSMPTPRITLPAPQCARSRSLDRDGLGQVAGLVDVEALGGGQLAGEDLERHRRHERCEQRRGLRHPDDHVGEGLDVGVALLGDDDGAGATGADLLDVADDLAVQAVLAARRRDDDEHRLPRLDQSDRAVLELAGGEALGVNVGELLELERTLERHGVADVTAEEEHRAGVGHEAGDLAHPVEAVEDLLDLAGDLVQVLHHGLRLVGEGAAPQLREVEAEDVAGRDLGQERLRGGDGDLGTGVGV